MWDAIRRKRTVPVRSAASVSVPARETHRVLVDCRICRAPNEQHREGCFNCGSLLRPVPGFENAVLERQALGGDEYPGRVEYVWK